MEFAVHEVIPESNSRTDIGRVVVNPPNANAKGPLACRTTGTFFMCCNRAFLTEDAYKSHLIKEREHGKAIDFSKFPESKFQEANNNKVEQDFDSTNRSLWIVRKKGCAKENETNEAPRQVKKEDNSVTNEPKSEVKGQKTCTLCGVQIHTCNLARHLKTAHVPDGIKCDYCCCTFLLNRSRIRHQFAVHGVRIRNRSTTNLKNTIISRAKKQFKSGSISNQIKIGGKDRHCPICGKDFVNICRLKEHMNSHTGARPYKCDVCGYKFSHRANMKRHKKTCHPGKNNKVVCRICKCSFTSHRQLTRHNNTMHPQKLKVKKLNSPNGKVSQVMRDRKDESAVQTLPSEMPNLKLECPTQNSSGLYVCNICQKELTTPQTWRGHMLIHQNLKPYKCKYCGIYFRLSGTRNQHVINSHGGGDFKCKNCTCCFKNKLTLVRHIQKYHSQGKNTNVKKLDKVKAEDDGKDNLESEKKTENVAGFKCNLCGTVVRMLKDFEVHKTLHTTTNRSKCNLCLKQFQSMANAKIHKRRAHGDATSHIYGCAFCCCRYTTSQAVFAHLVKEHEMNREDWDCESKSIKPEARRRIQFKLCTFDTKQEATEPPKAEKVKMTTPERKNGNVDKMATTGATMSKGSHECDICHLKFKVARSITAHKKKAHNHGAYICGICPCRYHKITWLKKHQLRVHGYVKLPGNKLKQPNVTFASKNSANPLASSTQSLRDDKTVECNFCKIKFKTQVSLATHKKKSHLHSGKFKCPQCPCKFKVLKGLGVHLNLYHGYIGIRRQRIFQRQGISSSSKPAFDNEDQGNALDMGENNTIETDDGNELVGEDLQRDKDDLNSAKKFECDLCNMKFSHRSTISNHKKKSHFHSGKFKCPKCTCKFLTAGGLLNHKKFHHGFVGKAALKRMTEIKKTVVESKSETPSKISRTPTKLASPKENANINLDRRTSREPGRVECKLCKLMVNRGKIKNHIATSHGSGTHSCSDCACVFTKSFGLTRHRIVYHRKNRNVDKTDKRAGSSLAGLLNSTSKVNLNFLKIRSPSAPKRNLPKSLYSHIKKAPVQNTETAVECYPSKPPRPASAATNYKYKCDQCGIKFTLTAYLRRHKARAHTEGGFSCSLCSCTFINGLSLAAHTRVYHSSAAKVQSSTSKRSKKFGQNKLSDKKEDKPSSSAIGKRVKRFKDVKSDSISKKGSSSETLMGKPSLTDIRTRHKTRLEESASSESTSQDNLGASVPENSNLVTSSAKQQYQCTWCIKSFHSLKTLEQHILSHTRPEMCQQCGMRFRTAVEVSHHVKTAHDKRSMHECPICCCRFTTSVGLASHHTKMHKKQSKSYDNIVIEHDEGAAVDDEPFIESVFANQNIADDLGDDSEPIVQGILETNYSPHEVDEDYNNEANFQDELGGIGATSEFQDDEEVEVYEDSEPIIRGVIEYNSKDEYPTTTSSTNTETTKKTFSPKSRPIKCCTCGVTCFGPENLRLHMQSHQQDSEHENENIQVDDDDDDNFVRKCDKCTYEFKTSHDLSQHMQLEHDESGMYRCAYCPCTMKNETNLRYHFLKYHSG